MEKVTRRAFIGGVGAILATGAMAMSGCAPKDDAKQAELSATGSDQPEATVPDETLEFDIAVVGAGCSGLAACVQAAESGASVICIEAKSIAGGAAGGVEGLFAVNSQIQKDQNITVSMGEMIRTELEQNQYRNSGLVLRDLVKASGEDIDWLVSKGVRFGKVDNYVGFHPIFHWFETGTGAESYIVPMNEAAVSEGVEFLFDTHADELICDEDGSVVGLFATKTDGTVVQVNARAVILATGGYAERLDLLAEFGYTEENCVPTTMGCDGSGHDMAIAVGGASNTSNMGMLGGTTVPDLPAFFEGGYFCSVMNSLANIPWVLWVNERGERFVNEDLSLANHMITANPIRMCKQAFILMDEAMMNDYVAGDAQGLKELEDGQAKGIIFKASNWKDLASSIGADAEILSETLESYNGCCEAGDDSDFGKASEFMRPLAMEGTVYAVEIKSSLGKTMGSLKTDRNFNVVDEQAEPIAGLYAVGVEGAMIWANVYTMNISGSCGAHNIYSGRTAVLHAVETRL